MDYTQLSDTQLEEHLTGITAEVQRRNQTQRLLDDAHNLIMTANNMGISRATVQGTLLDVLDTYYPG